MCAVEGCEEKSITRGLCPKHYMRVYKHGSPDRVFPRVPPPDPRRPETIAAAAAAAAEEARMKIITRQTAIARGLNRYFTGKPCQRGHYAERLVANYACVDCTREVNARPERMERRREADRHRRRTNRRTGTRQSAYENFDDVLANALARLDKKF